MVKLFVLQANLASIKQKINFVELASSGPIIWASSGQVSCGSSEFGVEKAKNVLSDWRRVVKLVGRR